MGVDVGCGWSGVYGILNDSFIKLTRQRVDNAVECNLFELFWSLVLPLSASSGGFIDSTFTLAPLAGKD